jgi:protein-tyrosine phosphatase
MIDFHTHILPGIDDGAKTPENSLTLLNTISNLGMNDAFLSPHFYPGDESLDSFVARRNESCKILASFLESQTNKMPKLHVSSEVYLEPILFNYDDLTPLTLDMGSKFMLTELLYEDSLSTSTQTMLKQLIYYCNIVPILAHVDRYPFLMKEKNLYSLLEMGCVAQMNLSSMSDFFKRKKLTKYLEKGYIGVIGSDIHNKTQTERITSGLSYINSEDLDYINEVSHGILKKVKRDSDNADSVIVVD